MTGFWTCSESKNKHIGLTKWKKYQYLDGHEKMFVCVTVSFDFQNAFDFSLFAKKSITDYTHYRKVTYSTCRRHEVYCWPYHPCWGVQNDYIKRSQIHNQNQVPELGSKQICTHSYTTTIKLQW